MSNFEQDDLMLRQAFQKSYQNIKMPEDLKQATLSEMMKNTKKTGKKLVGFGSAVAVLCAAALAFLVLRPSGVSYITPMEEGVYYDTVELKNGEIHFVKNRVAISITPNAGQIVIGGDSAVSTEEEKKTEVLEETVAESGGLLVFQETEQVSLPEIAEDNWSNIGEQTIYVTVLKTEEIRYQAVFEKNGTAYQVIGTDVTQKEFIDYLNDKINE
ncbi:MAG: hypothetical protein IJ409_07935 [Lachnospiraceae bacterium]|nr:hypothetical protein [Lachnospiraceae bacterium]